jgi:hypothetical protein
VQKKTQEVKNSAAHEPPKPTATFVAPTKKTDNTKSSVNYSRVQQTSATPAAASSSGDVTKRKVCCPHHRLHTQTNEHKQAHTDIHIRTHSQTHSTPQTNTLTHIHSHTHTHTQIYVSIQNRTRIRTHIYLHTHSVHSTHTYTHTHTLSDFASVLCCVESLRSMISSPLVSRLSSRCTFFPCDSPVMQLLLLILLFADPRAWIPGRRKSKNSWRADSEASLHLWARLGGIASLKLSPLGTCVICVCIVVCMHACMHV